MGGKTADEVEALLAEKLDPEDVDRTRDLPTDVLTAVQSRGSLGLGNQAALGGLGLSAHRAFRVFERAASRHP
ncbi:acyl-CoA dehydrogenase family protein [Streptomyces sp. NBC_01803]|uniref:acyl-CoA dehydrogenase family protein n=1 Tax=Streptomyces sp. NBC_01803 TaxID=2975946 RepID=UPI002DDB34FC|nr:acyl-CoA dehydrogenase family protein [Streptomyces sp. NBC_01803]WSA42973.1 hypothetical protein OIE51_01410 [Streptomyces sp. NBC_01803]